MGQLIKAKDIIEKRFGKKGTESREKFRDEAFSFYFGEIIKNRRKELKISQNELAELVGKKRPYISRIENGEDIRLSNFVLIANALNLSINQILLLLYEYSFYQVQQSWQQLKHFQNETAIALLKTLF